MTNGIGRMPSYANQVEPRDRWAIVAYIRALQLSQNARPQDVRPEDLAAGQRAAEQTGLAVWRGLPEGTER
jgi:mono/diheme cytochrome c family protein